MEVVVTSTLSSFQGQVVVATDPTQTVDNLIAAFCTERAVQFQRNFVLRTRNQQMLNNVKTLHASGINNGDVLLLGIKDDDIGWPCGCSQWWMLAGVALLIGCGGIIAVTIIKTQAPAVMKETQHGLVFDAGSSHTKMYVYAWPYDKDNGTGRVAQQNRTCEEDRGIATFAQTPQSAGGLLRRCLNEAKALPQVDHTTTPIYLGATAGMRLLRASNKNASDAIMNSVRKTIDSYDFKATNKVKIIEGKDEGAWSWVTLNYLTGAFGEPASLLSYFLSTPVPTTQGALDLGGASTQITFVPEHPAEVPKNYSERLVMHGWPYDVYTHSYLCYGLDEAHRKHLADLVVASNFSSQVVEPCLPKGFILKRSSAVIFRAPCTRQKQPPVPPEIKNFTFVGTSDSANCSISARSLFNFSACETPPCTFNGVYQPALHGEFKAFSGFYYTMDFLNLTEPGNTSLAEFEEAMDKYCNRSWPGWSEVPPPGDVGVPDVTRYCFNAHYIHWLLSAYGFNASNWDMLQFEKDVNGTELGWSLGFMLQATNSLPYPAPKPSLSNLMFTLLIILFCIFLLFAVGFACHARRIRTHKNDYEQLSSSYGAI